MQILFNYFYNANIERILKQQQQITQPIIYLLLLLAKNCGVKKFFIEFKLNKLLNLLKLNKLVILLKFIL